MRIHSWTGVNGASEELNRARTAAQRCAVTATDPTLRDDYEQPLAELEHQIERDRLSAGNVT